MVTFSYADIETLMYAHKTTYGLLGVNSTLYHKLVRTRAYMETEGIQSVDLCKKQV